MDGGGVAQVLVYPLLAEQENFYYIRGVVTISKRVVYPLDVITLDRVSNGSRSGTSWAAANNLLLYILSPHMFMAFQSGDGS